MYRRSALSQGRPLLQMLLAQQMLAVFCIFSRPVCMLLHVPEPLRLGGSRNRGASKRRKSDRRKKHARMRR